MCRGEDSVRTRDDGTRLLPNHRTTAGRDDQSRSDLKFGDLQVKERMYLSPRRRHLRVVGEVKGTVQMNEKTERRIGSSKISRP